jgi:spore maturation protein CgeB
VETVDIGTPRHPVGFQIHRALNWLGRPPDLYGANSSIRRQALDGPYSILWVDRGRWIRASTLRYARQCLPDIRMVSYLPDDMTLRGNSSPQFRSSLPFYDVHFTTKSHNIGALLAAGAKRVEWIGNAYDAATHRPLELSDDERARYGCEVGFVGAFEAERYNTLRTLSARGIEIKVRGFGWPPTDRNSRLVIHNERLERLDYAKAICATKINLGFLRKTARDQQTTRSVEIPACEGFLLAERTDEHLELFEEGKEAEFFGSAQEAEDKIRRYLAEDAAREAVASAGRQRCLDSGYSNQARLARALEIVRDINGGVIEGQAR